MFKEVYKPSLSDIGVVEPNLSVSIADILETHVVPDSGGPLSYSNESDIENVGHYIRDKIDGYVKARRLGMNIRQQMINNTKDE